MAEVPGGGSKGGLSCDDCTTDHRLNLGYLRSLLADTVSRIEFRALDMDGNVFWSSWMAHTTNLKCGLEHVQRSCHVDGGRAGAETMAKLVDYLAQIPSMLNYLNNTR